MARKIRKHNAVGDSYVVDLKGSLIPTNKCLVWCINSQENIYAVAYQPESDQYIEFDVQLEEPLNDRLAHKPHPRRVALELYSPFDDIEHSEFRVVAIEQFDRGHTAYVSRLVRQKAAANT
jgi:hypothetical protein